MFNLESPLTHELLEAIILFKRDNPGRNELVLYMRTSFWMSLCRETTEVLMVRRPSGENFTFAGYAVFLVSSSNHPDFRIT
jgi:hypothetical protein